MRRPTLGRNALFFSLIACAAPSDAQIYRWTDANGREHFSAHLSDVPESQRPAAVGGVGGGTLSSFGVEPRPQRTAGSEAEVRNATISQGATSARTLDEPRVGDRTETSWRLSAQDRIDAVARAEMRLEACHERDRRNRRRSGLTALDACETYERAIERAEERLSEFEQLARSQGVPPGWLR